MLGLHDARTSLERGMADVLQPLNPWQRPFFLQHLERLAKAKGDFLMLRAIRAYQKHHYAQTSIRPFTDD